MLYYYAMYIDIVPNRSSPPAILLRESYRDEHGKVKKRTLANLSCLSLEQAHKVREVLQGADLAPERLEDAFEILRSTPHGHVAAVLGTMNKLKLPSLLGRGDSPERRNALALIAGRIIEPGSKLALSRHLEGKSSTLGEELELDAELTEDDLYAAMRWLWERQPTIEARLAKRHLEPCCVVLYDLSSSYYEGSTCPLAERGHSRDGKKGKPQINYGLLTTREGCPVAVEVFPGNTGDPATVAKALDKLRRRFQIKKAVVVGDRGMLTSKQLEIASADERLRDYGWISALRYPQIKALAEKGDIQPELFDQRALAEIQSEQFPGERLVVCRNPWLAQQRATKRLELLAVTEKILSEIAQATQRKKNPYHGKVRIARRVEREGGKYKMLKHYELDISESSLSWRRKQKSIDEEAALDGFYVIRAINVDEQQMDSRQVVETYKSLSSVERAFRSLKTVSLKIRPIFHHLEEMVRAHIFLCMLAYWVQWHMEKSLKEILFADPLLEEQKVARPNPVVHTERSEVAKEKTATKQTDERLTVHSFRSLIENLASMCRSLCRANNEPGIQFTKVTRATRLHCKVFELLGLRPPSTVAK
jgi:transposase